MRLLKQLFWFFLTLGVLLAVLEFFLFDVVKIEWRSFMEVQPSYEEMEHPLPIPERSIPIEGAIAIPGMGAPENPSVADEASIARGAELYAINCQMCHGATGEGNGPIAAYLTDFKPANLTSALVQSKSDGSFFLAIS